mgnify:CR=1 FL=1|jgi:Flp pilus assembly protein TadB
MADEHYIETAVGSALAAIGAAWRWVRGREKKIHARLHNVEARIVTNDRRLAVLETQRQSDQDRMERIEGTIRSIDKKQDEQMKILVELAGRQGRRYE